MERVPKGKHGGSLIDCRRLPAESERAEPEVASHVSRGEGTFSDWRKLSSKPFGHFGRNALALSEGTEGRCLWSGRCLEECCKEIVLSPACVKCQRLPIKFALGFDYSTGRWFLCCILILLSGFCPVYSFGTFSAPKEESKHLVVRKFLDFFTIGSLLPSFVSFLIFDFIHGSHGHGFHGFLPKIQKGTK